MKKAVLYIAMSLDGYIADSEGGVGWLPGQNSQEEKEDQDPYLRFVKDIDTVIMGWKTYYQVTTELSPEAWVYSGFITYVFTHREARSGENIRFVDCDPAQFVEEPKAQDGKNIWICGGAELVQQLLRADVIDRFHISVIPTLLGEGIRLFGTFQGERKLRLTEIRNDNGVVEVVYDRRYRQ